MQLLSLSLDDCGFLVSHDCQSAGPWLEPRLGSQSVQHVTPPRTRPHTSPSRSAE